MFKIGVSIPKILSASDLLAEKICCAECIDRIEFNLENLLSLKRRHSENKITKTT